MGVSFVSPGVYTQELDFSLYAVRLSSAIFGVVGTATKGEVNELSLLGGGDALSNEYGNPAASVAVDADGVYIGGTQGLYQGGHFCRNGSILYFVRVAGSNLAYGSVTIDNTGTYYSGGTNALQVLGITPGTWVNGQVSINIENVDATTYNLKVYWQGAKVEEYKSVTQATVASSINGVSQYITVTVLDDTVIPGETLDPITAKPIRVDLDDGDDGIYASTQGTVAYPHIKDATTADTLKIVGIREGVLCNARDTLTRGFYVRLEETTVGITTYLKIGAYYNSTLIPGEEFLATTKAKLIIAVNEGSNYFNLEDASALAGEPEAGTPTNYGLTGGLTNANVIGTKSGNVSTGLQLFRNTDVVDVNIIAAPGMYHSSVLDELIDISESREDCLSILATPFDLTVEEITDWTNGEYTEDVDVPYPPAASLNSSYATLIYQWIRTYDSFNDLSVWTSSEGAFASIMANTDNVAEPWFAPAGQRRAKPSWIEDITYSPDRSEREILYGNPGTGQNACNYWINKRGVGIYLDGQRTLQRAATALDRVNVRRLLNILKKTLATSSEILLHDPNDATLWNQWEMMVKPFMRSVQAKRGLTAWDVKMNASTTTSLDIDQNTAVGRVYIQPPKSAERIILQFIITATGVSFTEILG